MIAGFACPPLAKQGAVYGSGVNDPVDEALYLFRPNSFFKHFEIKGAADRTLCYLLLFMGECLGKLNDNMTATEVAKVLQSIGTQAFAVPGEPSFPLNAILGGAAVNNGAEIEKLRAYLAGCRQELIKRLPALVIDQETGRVSKWWVTKRRFMNKSL